ncbi:MAG: 50S ribosomal protein L21 [Candidatus Peribacteraceae bacterium]|nr:50S ribosomal protein L21 [Candidatus Peribacteraceae bacterium]
MVGLPLRERPVTAENSSKVSPEQIKRLQGLLDPLLGRTPIFPSGRIIYGFNVIAALRERDVAIPCIGFSTDFSLAPSHGFPYTPAVMFAVVSIAGFQEKVSEGDKIKVPLIAAEPGKTVTFDKVMLVSKDKAAVTIGTPLVTGASVTAKVLKHGKTDKVRGAIHGKRKRQLHFFGHRQDFTEVEVTKIQG